MFALAIFVVLVGVCVVSAFFGADSRYDRPGRQL
jgi:hypothetical protein